MSSWIIFEMDMHTHTHTQVLKMYKWQTRNESSLQCGWIFYVQCALISRIHRHLQMTFLLRYSTQCVEFHVADKMIFPNKRRERRVCVCLRVVCCCFSKYYSLTFIAAICVASRSFILKFYHTIKKCSATKMNCYTFGCSVWKCLLIRELKNEHKMKLKAKIKDKIGCSWNFRFFFYCH